MKLNPSWPDVTGPLAPYAVAYRSELLERLGYSASSTTAHLYVMADLSRWLGERGRGITELDAALIDEFLATRRAAGRAKCVTPRALRPLIDLLEDLEVIGEASEPLPVDPLGRLLADFAVHLREARGLRPTTIAGYVRVARTFLLACAPDLEAQSCGVERLSMGEINAFLLGEGARRNLGDTHNLVSSLRVLLRFFYLTGRTPTCIADCVPGAADWRDSARSKAVSAAAVQRLLRSCDRRRTVGRRDFAILTVLCRLGLRAGEVAALDLDDLDWRAGELTVSGKGGRHSRLPIPVDVGQAIAAYCEKGRPRNGQRALFLHARAPYARLSPSAVSQVVLAASKRAGLPAIRAHRLRHTSASAMRRAGAPLFEVGQVLRHRWAATTALYAKDDLSALADIARPWPGATR